MEKNKQRMLVISLAVALVTAIASLVVANRKTERAGALARISPPAMPPATSEATPPLKNLAVETNPQIQPVQAAIQPMTKPQKITAQSAPPANVKEPIQDPTARTALSLVGADPDAEQYWVGAINDPNLSAHERQDLIEDLNEDGLSDPKHPGPQDLPLILNRVQLIEELVPYAMDQVNAEAFAEAYKDLNNMLVGKPVQ
jgi:hypothetical protein